MGQDMAPKTPTRSSRRRTAYISARAVLAGNGMRALNAHGAERLVGRGGPGEQAENGQDMRVLIADGAERLVGSPDGSIERAERALRQDPCPPAEYRNIGGMRLSNEPAKHHGPHPRVVRYVPVLETKIRLRHP